MARSLHLAGLRTFASLVRLHIVAIAALGTFTFGWVFTGRRPWLLAAITALDWFLVNLLNRLVDQQEDQANGVSCTGFVGRRRRPLLWGGLGVLLLSLPLLHLLAPTITPFRVTMQALGLAYNFPLRPSWRRLKQLYLLKNVASATGFMLTVFAYPLAAAWDGHRLALAPGISGGTLLAAALFFFLFELSYEVIYDLRDAPGDAAAAVRTLPVVHGQRSATLVVDALILGSISALLLGRLLGVVPWRLFIMICAPLLQLGIYKRAVQRGISGVDCVRITWMGAGLLLTYHLWIVLGLPGVNQP